MRLHFELTITLGKDDDEPAHVEDQTGYLAPAGTPAGFNRECEGDNDR